MQVTVDAADVISQLQPAAYKEKKSFLSVTALFALRCAPALIKNTLDQKQCPWRVPLWYVWYHHWRQPTGLTFASLALAIRSIYRSQGYP